MNEIKLADFYRDYFAPLKLRSRSSRTRDLYGISLRHFDKFLGRQATLADCEDDTVSRYLSWFRQLPRSPASVYKERNNLLAIWRFAARKRFVERWPDVEPDIEPNRVPMAWTQEDVNRLFQAVEHVTGNIGIIPATHWWSALLYVVWDTAERIGAVIALRWRDVDLAGQFVVCRAENRKGHRNDRLYRIEQDTTAALQRIAPEHRNDSRPVFPWPYSAKYLWNGFGKILESASLPHDSLSKFHRIRRTVASYCEANGGNATELLDHSRRSVTMRYLDPRIVGTHFATEYLFRPSRIQVNEVPDKQYKSSSNDQRYQVQD